MPVAIHTVPRTAQANFNDPHARAAYAEPFSRIGIPAVAAAAAQVKRPPLAEARRQLRRDDLPAVLRGDDHLD